MHPNIFLYDSTYIYKYVLQRQIETNYSFQLLYNYIVFGN